MKIDVHRHYHAAADVGKPDWPPLEAELARRGVRLKRAGHELIGPCPVCGGVDRFGVSIAKQVWNCRGCAKGGDVADLVQHLDGVGFATAVETLTGERPRRRALPHRSSEKIQNHDDYERRQHAKAAWLWRQRQPIIGSIAEVYLRAARGITCALPPTLAFLPPLKPEHHPAMCAAFALPDEIEPGQLGEPQNVEAIHLTLLRPDGTGKAEVEPNKLMIGSPNSTPIVVAPPNDLLGLAITEGIEDALSAYQVTGLGAWAAGSAGRMPKLADTVPFYIECVPIWTHDDIDGRRYARELAELLHRRGVEVFIEGEL